MLLYFSFVFLIGAFLCKLLHGKYLTYRARVDQIPGPPVDSLLLGNLKYFIKPQSMQKNVHIKEFYQKFNQLYRKYSETGVFRLWLGPLHVLYVLTNAESVECLLTSSVNINKGSEYQFMASWLGDGLLLLNSDKWKDRRKLLSPAFHYSALKDFLPIFRSHTAKLLTQIDSSFQSVHSHSVIIPDIRPLFEDCMLNIIKETSLGGDKESSAKDYSHTNETYRESLKQSIILSVNRIQNPAHWIDALFRFTAKGRQFYSGLEFLKQYADKIINNRLSYLLNLQSPSLFTPTKLIDILLRKYLTDVSSQLNPRIIRNEVNTFIFGGHDTTAIASTFTLLLIGHHPKVQEKIHRELDGIFNENILKCIDLNDLRQMHYLEATIKESLRLYPPAQLIGRHLTQALRLPNGHTLHPGANCYIPINFLHRSPKYFPKPDSFHPERFASSPKHPNAYTFLPFSAGPRNCIGQRYGMLELKLVLASILRQYRVTSLTKAESILIGITPVTKPLSKMEISFERRKTRECTNKGE